jgi:hypothetical protein
MVFPSALFWMDAMSKLTALHHSLDRHSATQESGTWSTCRELFRFDMHVAILIYLN